MLSLQKSKYAVRPRMIEFALMKKEEGPYWDRLLKVKTKQHWLKIDFNKWKNEDSDDEDAEGGGQGGQGGGDLEEVRISERRILKNWDNQKPRGGDSIMGYPPGGQIHHREVSRDCTSRG